MFIVMVMLTRQPMDDLANVYVRAWCSEGIKLSLDLSFIIHDSTIFAIFAINGNSLLTEFIIDVQKILKRIMPYTGRTKYLNKSNVIHLFILC